MDEIAAIDYNMAPAEAWRAKNFYKIIKPQIWCDCYSFDNLFQWLCLNKFFRAPASIRHHGTYPGALYDHSFTMMQALLSLTRRLDLKWERENSPYIVGMFHDLCKVDDYREREESRDEWGREYKDNERWEYNDTSIFPGHGEKSVMLLQHFMKITEEEMFCIRWHMGAFEGKERWGGYSRAVAAYPNILYTHTADMIASQITGV